MCLPEAVFRRWKRLGLNYMFLGLEALDEEGLMEFRKRTTPAVDSKALELARSIGLTVAINIIADPDWDETRFTFVREWAMSVPLPIRLPAEHPVKAPSRKDLFVHAPPTREHRR